MRFAHFADSGISEKEIMSTETKICKKCSREFTIETEDSAYYEHIQVPPPSMCPDCRAQRRMVWWNEHNLYRKKVASPSTSSGSASGEVFSTYPEHSPIKIYEHGYWWSDAWDPMQFGRDYDPKRSFFDQMKELMHVMPRSSREIKSLTNSDYSDNSNNVKNGYLCFDASNCDDIMYCIALNHCKNSLDVYQANGLELSYEILQCGHMYQSFFCHDSGNCRNVWLSRDCIDCEDCFGCANLRHKKYYIFNEPYTKGEYEKKIKEFNLGSYASLSKLKEQARKVWVEQPYKFMHGMQNENVTGDYIEHCKNVHRGFQIDDSSDVRYSQRIVNDSKFIVDVTNWGDNSEYVYEGVVCGENNRNIKFCAYCWPANTDIEYCMSCHSSSNLFGCIGMRKKEYCILNKQYTREEYFAKIQSIKIQMTKDGEYGEFFPASMSPLAYNETVALDYFQRTKEQALAEGFAWRDPEKREHKITMEAIDIPDHIWDVSLDITKAIIGCSTCKRAYRILDREFEFYQRFGLPIPRECHNCRHTERLKLRTPLQSWKRNCAKCGVAVESNFAPDRPEIVYCESCYNDEIV